MRPRPIPSIVALLTVIAGPPAAQARALEPSEVVLLEDDFTDNRHRWVTGRREHAMLQIRNGQYMFRHFRRSDDEWMTWRTVRTHHDANFRIETRIRKRSGSTTAGYGLIFGATGADAFKSFLIRGDGKFRYGEKTAQGGFKTVAGWRSSPAIKRGSRATNVLGVTQRGSKLELSVNGKTVATVSMTEFAGHKLGFQVRRRQTIGIQWLRVSEVSPPRAPSADLPGRTRLLDEHFSTNRGRWAETNDNNKSLQVRGGFYEFEHKRPRSDWLTWKSVGLKPDDDYRVEARIIKSAGIQDHGYGIVFGFKDTNNFFSFLLSGDGHYRYGEKRSGKFESITGWVRHPAIREGNGASNRLAVHRRGGALFLFVNGTVVDRVPAKRLKGDKVGFQLNRKQAVSIDSLRVDRFPRRRLGMLARPRRLPRPTPYVPPTTEPPPTKPPAAAAPPPPRPPASSKAPPPPAPPPIAPGRQYVVAVFEVEDGSGQLKDDVRRQLTEYLSALLAQKGSYAVVPMAQIRARIRSSKADSYKDCYDESCQIEIGKAVAAEGVIATKLLKVGDACAIASKLYDLRKEATARAATADTDCATSALLGAVRTIAGRL